MYDKKWTIYIPIRDDIVAITDQELKDGIDNNYIDFKQTQIERKFIKDKIWVDGILNLNIMYDSNKEIL